MAGHGFLPNGWIDGSKTTLHAVVMFKCYDGMKFEGASERLVTLFLLSAFYYSLIPANCTISSGNFCATTFIGGVKKCESLMQNCRKEN